MTSIAVPLATANGVNHAHSRTSGQTLDGVLHRQDPGTYPEAGRSGGSAEVGLVLAAERHPAGLAILAPWL